MSDTSQEVKGEFIAIHPKQALKNDPLPWKETNPYSALLNAGQAGLGGYLDQATDVLVTSSLKAYREETKGGWYLFWGDRCWPKRFEKFHQDQRYLQALRKRGI